MMIADVAYAVTLVASLIWFSMALRFFGFKGMAAASILIPKSARSSPLFLTMAAAVRFLGGMNGAFALLAGILLVLLAFDSELFRSNIERGTLILVLGAAHVSQFLGNVPILRNGERQGDAYWPVLSGPMRIIFLVDAAQSALCAAVALLLFML